MPDVYFGHTSISGGKLKKAVFDSLVKLGLSSRDTLGNTYKVLGFDFTYAERNLYEDSTANYIVVADYNYEYCPGDTISKGISRSLFSRTKPGDTVFFDKIKVLKQLKDPTQFLPDSMAIIGRAIKCVIVK